MYRGTRDTGEHSWHCVCGYARFGHVEDPVEIDRLQPDEQVRSGAAEPETSVR